MIGSEWSQKGCQYGKRSREKRKVQLSFSTWMVDLNEMRLLCGLLPLEADLQIISLGESDLPCNPEGLDSPYQERS